ncbi:radical SAM protein [Parabacteroides acidifaciens]|uniref:Radical SAM protein n=1 Tax=Parabacteroides acidifaciens TaxID=2290935 RepID=A0A3D8HDI6_9BACT|nr:radical SAM protein [Parabacteroides acidifaciens]MBC8602231.1 radical SAM protein [Parabacteroides acidifaciens]RDU49043.1 radical SAM protein [Parabacteroides acidifaciens]
MVQRKNHIYVLNPCYVLRNDVYRIILFSRIRHGVDCSKDWQSFIHPLQAILLSFFTYNRTLQENIEALANFFHRDVTYMERLLDLYLENESPVYTVWNGQKIVFPKKILIRKEDAGNDFQFIQLKPDNFVCGKLDLFSRRLYSGPLLLTFMLTNQCVTHCKYCYADTKTKVRHLLPASRILALIQEAADLQVQQVALIGGEVFLRPDWEVILKELVRRDIAPGYLSTKIPFTAELLERLRKTGYSHIIQVSLDAVSSSVLQESLRVSDTYWQNMEHGLRLLDQSGFDYQVSTVVSTYNCNCHVLTDLFRFLLTLENLSDWRIVPVSNSLHVAPGEMKKIKPSYEELIGLFDYIQEFIIPASPFTILLNESFRQQKFHQTDGGSRYFEGSSCSALNTHLFILPDGQATICEQLYWHPSFIIGDATIDYLKEIWNSPRSIRLVNLSQKEIQKTSTCKNCTLFNSCFQYRNRCWSDIVKAYGKKYWDFPDPRCLISPKMINNLGY